MGKALQPWVQWYWSDWRSDPCLRLCSLEARGFWAEILGIMHESDPYGHLLVNGAIPSQKQLALMTGASVSQVRRLTKELTAAGVCSFTDQGVMYCRRMVRDHERKAKAREYGATGGNPSLKGRVNPRDNPEVNPDANPRVKGCLNTHIPDARCQMPETLNQQVNAPSALAPEGKVYAWSGRTIRLTAGDLAKWQAAYPNVDMQAELQLADDYYSERPAPKNGWFFAVSNWLKRANERARQQIQPAASTYNADGTDCF